MNRQMLILLQLLSLFNILFSGALILTNNSIVDEAGNQFKNGAFLDLLFDGKNVYYILQDGIYTLDGKTKIDIKNAQKVGTNYVLASSKVYKISNGTATVVATISSAIQNIHVKDGFVLGIEKGQVTCYYEGKIVWSMSTIVNSFKVSGNYLAAFGAQTLLINISNPQYLKLERIYPPFKDYAYFSEYHAFSDGTKIYIYKGPSRLSTTFPYKGPLFSDGENLYSGNIIVNDELLQKDLKFYVKSLVPYPSNGGSETKVETNIPQEPIKQSQTDTSMNITQQSQQPTQSVQQEAPEEQTIVKPVESKPIQRTPKLFEMVWKVILNDQISGKPAIKGEQLYIPLLKGSVINISGGKIDWTFRAGFVVVGHVTVGNNIYVVSWDDTVYAINENGALNWKIKLDSDISQGPSWDGYNLYVLTDNGTVYVIRDEIKSGRIVSSYKTAAYPVLPPSVSLAGKIYVIDGLGNLWRDKTSVGFVGKVKNLPILYENHYITKELGFTLIDELGVSYQFIPLERETQVVKENKNVFVTINDQVIDAVLGRNYVYAIGNSGRFYVIDKDTRKTLFTDVVPGGKYIGLSNGYLYVFGREIRCYYTNDNPTGFWNSLYANQFNWNSAVK
ncbi:MAG: PQQ-like beta-propeller repeat protein [Fervidobacterium sp.]|nr:PQQ-like beta-propeller repeat protein [Fervidobacterium sp.]